MIEREQVEKLNIKKIDTRKVMSKDKAEVISNLKKLIPQVVNSDNQVDVRALNDFLGGENTTSNNTTSYNQGYELTFAGKGLAKAKADSETEKELFISPQTQKQSKDFDKTKNVVIRGDNLDVLKILKQNYHGKVKMIYIDPPYNTKSENFVYNDNFKKNDEEMIEEFGLGEDTIDFLQNVYGNRSHSGWLSFMYPRLKLAKDLLTDDGVIFISIDDNEQANLKIVCDEIFGEGNFVVEIIRKTKSTTNDAKQGINIQHENCLVYGKHKDNLIVFGGEKDFSKYSNPDNDPNGDWVSNDPSAKSGKESNYFEIKNPYTGKIDLPPTGMYWRFSKNTIQKHIDYGTLCFKKKHKENERGFIYKRYVKDLKTTKKTLDSLACIENEYMNQNATKYLLSIGMAEYFKYPKGINFIKKLLLHSTNPNDLILDFFAGSGTTGDAVMQLNAEDGGNRKYVLVQWDELINKEKNKEAYDFCEKNKFDTVIHLSQ